LVKLSAFLECYTRGLSASATDATVNLFKAWNSGGNFNQAWASFLEVKTEIAEHNRRWAAQLAENPDLANALVKFCAAKV